MSKLKEIEKLEKQAQEAEEKSMALKVRAAAKDSLRGLGWYLGGVQFHGSLLGGVQFHGSLLGGV